MRRIFILLYLLSSMLMGFGIGIIVHMHDKAAHTTKLYKQPVNYPFEVASIFYVKRLCGTPVLTKKCLTVLSKRAKY